MRMRDLITDRIIYPILICGTDAAHEIIVCVSHGCDTCTAHSSECVFCDEMETLNEIE